MVFDLISRSTKSQGFNDSKATFVKYELLFCTEIYFDFQLLRTQSVQRDSLSDQRIALISQRHANELPANPE